MVAAPEEDVKHLAKDFNISEQNARECLSSLFPDETWINDCLSGLSTEPMTDDEFDVYIGFPIGTTRIQREQEEFKRRVNFYT